MKAPVGWLRAATRPATRAPIGVVVLALCALGMQALIMHWDATWREIDHTAYFGFAPGTFLESGSCGRGDRLSGGRSGRAPE